MNFDDLEAHEAFRAVCDRAVFAKYGAAYVWYVSEWASDGQNATATLTVTVPAAVRKAFSIEGDARGLAPHGYQAVTYSAGQVTYFIPVPTQERLRVQYSPPFTE